MVQLFFFAIHVRPPLLAFANYIQSQEVTHVQVLKTLSLNILGWGVILFADDSTMKSAAQVIVGGVTSNAVTVKLQEVEFPLASVAVSVTVVFPSPEIGEPGVGLWVTTGLPSQLSETPA